MDKLVLRTNIMDELEFEPSIDAAHIGVAVEDGVVTLSGYVTSYAEKTAAVAAAYRVRGVKAIADEITVRFPGHTRSADDEVAKRALDIMRWDATVPQDDIRVTVRDGWLTLTGEVTWQYQRRAAEDAVRKLSGIVGVVNNVNLKSVVQLGDIKTKIEAALKRRAEVEASKISVIVKDGGIVVLNGTVDNWEERQAVDSAAWSAFGVRSVEDHIRIGT